MTSRRYDEDTVSNSCHVFMTESPGTPDELRRRAKAFQIDDDASCFPANAEPIMNAVLSLYGPPQQQPEAGPEAAEDSSSDSNSDSGIGFRDPALLPVGLGPPATPDPPAGAVGPADNSFNSEVLESQNSAENLRQSMQRSVKTATIEYSSIFCVCHFYRLPAAGQQVIKIVGLLVKTKLQIYGISCC